MKRLIIYVVLMIAVLLIPTERTDLEKLKPVEAVLVYREEEQIVITTDTADLGRGESIDAALKNLKESAPGIIYLDTADYLLITQDTEEQILQLRGNLKGTVRICMTEGEIDMERVGEYLSVHKPEKKLRDWKAGDAIEILYSEDDRLILK